MDERKHSPELGENRTGYSRVVARFIDTAGEASAVGVADAGVKKREPAPGEIWSRHYSGSTIWDTELTEMWMEMRM